MAKIKAGQSHTATSEVIQVHVENASERGGFHVHMGASKLEPDQARHLAAILTDAADKAEILEAAVGG
jgi:hypothetical protein